MNKPLTDRDISFLKEQTKPAYVFAGFTITLLFFFDIVILINEYDITPKYVYLINIAAIIISVIILYLVSNKYRQDIKSNKKKTHSVKLQNKAAEITQEAGSGTLHQPILGEIFPKLWGQKMKELNVYYLVIDNTRYEVTKELFEAVEVGESLEFHYSYYSNVLICIYSEPHFSYL